MKQTLKVFLTAVAAAVILSANAKLSVAATATNNLTVQATVAATCTITAQTQTYAYEPIVTNKTTDLTSSANSVSVTCTSGHTPTSIALDEGLNKCTAVAGFCTAISSAAAPARQMGLGTARLAYNLFGSAANQTTGTPAAAWGTANGPTLSAGTGAAQTYTVFVKIPANQQVGAGTYADTVVQTITF